MRISVVLTWAVAAALLIRPEAQSKQPSFEVASIRVNNSGDAGSGSRNDPGGRITIYNTTLREMIRQAYDVKHYQVTGGPAWIDSQRFDVAATAEGNPNQERLRSMMQTLLSTRFKVLVHRERKELPAYVLAVTRRGATLEKTKGGNSSLSVFPTKGIIRATSTSMAQLADRLSRLLDRPVQDKSGIQGQFDFQLEYAPLTSGGEPTSPQNSPSIFTALAEQLGLRLEPTTSAVDIIVVDRAERPTEN